jgi:uncharacterized protein (TIGR03000 family)
MWHYSINYADDFRVPRRLIVFPTAPRYEVAGRSEASAQVEVRLPADAELWFNGTKMKTTGASRWFETPSLKVGPRFSYDARASWKEKGRLVTQSQEISVSARDVIHVTFPMTGRTK